MRWPWRRDDPPPRGRRHAGAPVVPVARPVLPDLSTGPVQVVPPARAGGVGLVFADGDEVRLAPDDPRVRAFAAATAALLGR